MAQRRKSAKPLRRRAASRPERRTVVVFTEGKNSEPDYINGLKRLPHIATSIAVNIELAREHGVPLTLVQRAIDLQGDPEVDECWCVFDVEWPRHHPNLVSALTLAATHGVRLAISNPCFEVWLILHYRDHRQFLNTGDAERMSRKVDQRTGKSIDPDLYIPRRREAVRRAQLLAARHQRDGAPFPHDNPSSSMYELLNSLEPE